MLEKQLVQKSAVLNVKAVPILYKKYLLLLVLYASLVITLFAVVLKEHILLSYAKVVYSVSFSGHTFCFLKNNIQTVNAFLSNSKLIFHRKAISAYIKQETDK